MYAIASASSNYFALDSSGTDSATLTSVHCIRTSPLSFRIRSPNVKPPAFLSYPTQLSHPKSHGKPDSAGTWSAGDEIDLHSPVVADSLKLLEWPKVCEAVAAFSGTPLGKEALKEQLSSVNLSCEQSEALLSETAAGIEFLKFCSNNVDFSGIRTVEAKYAIDRASRGFVMDGNEALAIAILLQFCNELQTTLKIAVKEDAEWHMRFMPLTDMINDMVINKVLIQAVLEAVDEGGSLKDDASSELKRTRNQVRRLEQQLYELMSKVVRDGGIENNSPEISYVDGRWCIKVGVDQPNGFQGIILWSGSGVEKYVEPVAAVALNDKLAEARVLVAKAEHEVLASLTKKVLPYLGDIQCLLESVIRLDVVMSRAKYSLAFGGTRPILSFIESNRLSSSQQLDAENQDSAAGMSFASLHGEDWLLHLRKVYHPLLLQQHRENLQELKQKVNATRSQLQRARMRGESSSSKERLESLLKSLQTKVAALEEVHPIPIDVLIRKKTKVVVITGPNTGGKTATLKTVGLAALMAKSGLYVLAAEPVHLPCFDSIFVDMGDEQSLSQSFSTFSGHLYQIKSIQLRSTGCSLVLLDEVGAGTNPLEGAALGMSLLESFADHGSLLTIATTHHGELKMLKYSDDRFENACVEFDEEHLRPTYKLLWGIPGRSNAINIAKRLGLPMQIIDHARQLYGTTSVEINKVIIDLERAKRDYQEGIQKAGHYLTQSRILYERLMEVNNQMLDYSSLQQYRKSQEIFEAAANARSALYRTMRIFRENQSKVSLTRNETTNVHLSGKASVDHMAGNINNLPDIGQMVHVPSLGKKAKVLKVNENNNEILVQTGSLKLKLRLNEWRTN